MKEHPKHAAKSSSRPGATAHELPKKGDQYRCDACGMELEITVDCHCDDEEHVHFECCGHELARH